MLEHYKNMFLGCPGAESQRFSHCIHKKEGKSCSPVRAGLDWGTRHFCGDETLVLKRELAQWSPWLGQAGLWWSRRLISMTLLGHRTP